MSIKDTQILDVIRPFTALAPEKEPPTAIHDSINVDGCTVVAFHGDTVDDKETRRVWNSLLFPVGKIERTCVLVNGSRAVVSWSQKTRTISRSDVNNLLERISTAEADCLRRCKDLQMESGVVSKDSKDKAKKVKFTSLQALDLTLSKLEEEKALAARYSKDRQDLNWLLENAPKGDIFNCPVLIPAVPGYAFRYIGRKATVAEEARIQNLFKRLLNDRSIKKPLEALFSRAPEGATEEKEGKLTVLPMDDQNAKILADWYYNYAKRSVRRPNSVEEGLWAWYQRILSWNASHPQQRVPCPKGVHMPNDKKPSGQEKQRKINESLLSTVKDLAAEVASLRRGENSISAPKPVLPSYSSHWYELYPFEARIPLGSWVQKMVEKGEVGLKTSKGEEIPQALSFLIHKQEDRDDEGNQIYIFEGRDVREKQFSKMALPEATKHTFAFVAKLAALCFNRGLSVEEVNLCLSPLNEKRQEKAWIKVVQEEGFKNLSQEFALNLLSDANVDGGIQSEFDIFDSLRADGYSSVCVHDDNDVVILWPIAAFLAGQNFFHHAPYHFISEVKGEDQGEEHFILDCSGELLPHEPLPVGKVAESSLSIRYAFNIENFREDTNGIQRKLMADLITKMELHPEAFPQEQREFLPAAVKEFSKLINSYQGSADNFKLEVEDFLFECERPVAFALGPDTSDAQLALQLQVEEVVDAENVGTSTQEPVKTPDAEDDQIPQVIHIHGVPYYAVEEDDMEDDTPEGHVFVCVVRKGIVYAAGLEKAPTAATPKEVSNKLVTFGFTNRKGDKQTASTEVKTSTSKGLIVQQPDSSKSQSKKPASQEKVEENLSSQVKKEKNSKSKEQPKALPGRSSTSQMNACVCLTYPCKHTKQNIVQAYKAAGKETVSAPKGTTPGMAWTTKDIPIKDESDILTQENPASVKGVPHRHWERISSEAYTALKEIFAERAGKLPDDFDSLEKVERRKILSARAVPRWATAAVSADPLNLEKIRQGKLTKDEKILGKPRNLDEKPVRKTSQPVLTPGEEWAALKLQYKDVGLWANPQSPREKQFVTAYEKLRSKLGENWAHTLPKRKRRPRNIPTGTTGTAQRSRSPAPPRAGDSAILDTVRTIGELVRAFRGG